MYVQHYFNRIARKCHKRLSYLKLMLYEKCHGKNMNMYVFMISMGFLCIILILMGKKSTPFGWYDWMVKRQRKKKRTGHTSMHKSTHIHTHDMCDISKTKQNKNTIYTKRNVMSEMTNILMLGPQFIVSVRTQRLEIESSQCKQRCYNIPFHLPILSIHTYTCVL